MVKWADQNSFYSWIIFPIRTSSSINAYQWIWIKKFIVVSNENKLYDDVTLEQLLIHCENGKNNPLDFPFSPKEVQVGRSYQVWNLENAIVWTLLQMNLSK